MILPLIFWLVLLLPGYVVVRRVSPDDLKSGLLGTIGLSYLAVFALLSPISIVGYLLHLPLAVLSFGCVAAVAAALVDITRRGWWRDVGRLLLTGLGVEMLIVVADLVLSGYAGGYLSGDAKTHVARIRLLVDHGLINREPYVAPAYFFPVYHTNIMHALHAACIQITRADLFAEWFINLVWAKLVIAGGMYFMAWSLFERRWLAWLTVVFVVGQQAPVPFLLYLNKLAPMWLLPLMVGFSAQICGRPCGWRVPLKLAAGSLVLGQVHGLYAVFAGLALGPYLAGAFLARLRRSPDRWRVAAGVAALGAAVPFVLVGKYGMAERRGGAPSSWVERDKQVNKRFHHFEDGSHMARPRPVVEYELLALGALCAMAGARRKQAAALVVMAGVGAAILFIPPVCTAAIKLFGPPHTVYRMHAMTQLAFRGLVPGSLGYLLEFVLRRGWLRAPASVLVFLLGAQLAPAKTYTWRAYCRTATSSREVRHRQLTTLQRDRAFFQAHIPVGATVLADRRTAMWLVMAHDCRVVLHHRVSQGIPDVHERVADLGAMLAPDTPWAARRELLGKYDVRLFLVAGAAARDAGWARGHVANAWRQGRYQLLALKTD